MIEESQLTRDQQNAIKNTKEWFSSLENENTRKTWRYVGYAGTGKTTSAIFTVEACGIDPGSEDLCAAVFTGKGAQRLREAGLYQARTIHSLIYLPPLSKRYDKEEALKENITRLRFNLEKGENCFATLKEQESILHNLLRDSDSQRMEFILNPESSINDCKLVFIDEASMVGGRIQRDLESFGKPIIYCGDSFQLPPIEKSESALFDEYSNPLPPDVEIHEIVRQLADNPIVRAASDIRVNGDLPSIGKQGSKEQGVLVSTHIENIKNEHLVKASQIIVGRNLTRMEYNNRIRDYLGYESSYPYKDEKLICLKNHHISGLFNGMMGNALIDSHPGTNEIYFRINMKMDSEEIPRDIKALRAYFQQTGSLDKKINFLPKWALKDYVHLDYGYAITLHKAQGSEWRSVILFDEPIGRTIDERLRWWYTGFTRARNTLVFVH